MSGNYQALRNGLDEMIVLEQKCIQGITVLLTEMNEEKQNPILNKLVETLGEWFQTPLAVTLQEIEDIKKTCCLGSVRGNLSDSSDSLVGVEKMAEILGVDKNWLYQRTRSKKIPFVKVGKYVRFAPKEVLESLK